MKQIVGTWLPDTDTYFTHILQKYGAFEPGRLRLALQYIKGCMTAYDIGAHVGLRSLELAPIFGHVFAFEPNPPTYECLVRNMSDSPNVIPLHYALGATEGEVGMIESTTRPGNSGSYFCTGGVGIEMRTLKTLNLPPPDFMKIDVEGFEDLVLLGGEEMIRSQKPVILVEEKNFRDTEGRINNGYRAAGHLLEKWGAVRKHRINNDAVYIWE